MIFWKLIHPETMQSLPKVCNKILPKSTFEFFFFGTKNIYYVTFFSVEFFKLLLGDQTKRNLNKGKWNKSPSREYYFIISDIIDKACKSRGVILDQHFNRDQFNFQIIEQFNTRNTASSAAVIWKTQPSRMTKYFEQAVVFKIQDQVANPVPSLPIEEIDPYMEFSLPYVEMERGKKVRDFFPRPFLSPPKGNKAENALALIGFQLFLHFIEDALRNGKEIKQKENRIQEIIFIQQKYTIQVFQDSDKGAENFMQNLVYQRFNKKKKTIDREGNVRFGCYNGNVQPNLYPQILGAH